ncbi:MAG: hypothetical protein K6G19_08335 [Lachnospiraceae bacterium]|nr:hypothetical protein [Lachnospiraceae bacterium]
MEANGLTDGVSDFWGASIVTALSEGKVRIRPVTTADGALKPVKWRSKDKWYEGSKQFVLMPNGCADPSEESVVAICEEPDKVITTSQANIYVYNEGFTVTAD